MTLSRARRKRAHAFCALELQAITNRFWRYQTLQLGWKYYTNWLSYTTTKGENRRKVRFITSTLLALQGEALLRHYFSRWHSFAVVSLTKRRSCIRQRHLVQQPSPLLRLKLRQFQLSLPHSSNIGFHEQSTAALESSSAKFVGMPNTSDLRGGSRSPDKIAENSLVFFPPEGSTFEVSFESLVLHHLPLADPKVETIIDVYLRYKTRFEKGSSPKYCRVSCSTPLQLDANFCMSFQSSNCAQQRAVPSADADSMWIGLYRKKLFGADELLGEAEISMSSACNPNLYPFAAEEKHVMQEIVDGKVTCCEQHNRTIPLVHTSGGGDASVVIVGDLCFKIICHFDRKVKITTLYQPWLLPEVQKQLYLWPDLQWYSRIGQRMKKHAARLLRRLDCEIHCRTRIELDAFFHALLPPNNQQ